MTVTLTAENVILGGAAVFVLVSLIYLWIGRRYRARAYAIREEARKERLKAKEERDKAELLLEETKRYGILVRRPARGKWGRLGYSEASVERPAAPVDPVHGPPGPQGCPKGEPGEKGEPGDPTRPNSGSFLEAILSGIVGAGIIAGVQYLTRKRQDDEAYVKLFKEVMAHPVHGPESGTDCLLCREDRRVTRSGQNDGQGVTEAQGQSGVHG